VALNNEMNKKRLLVHHQSQVLVKVKVKHPQIIPVVMVKVLMESLLALLVTTVVRKLMNENFTAAAALVTVCHCM
jgi:hypothetical protein